MDAMAHDKPVRRYHRHYKSSGHVWQGRFKSFPIQEDEHLLTVVRYVEMNPVRAKSLGVSRTSDWPWSSAGRPPGNVTPPPLALDSIIPNARKQIPRQLSKERLTRLRLSLDRGRPFGDPQWQATTSPHLGLESTLRPKGRPKK